jgi:hypothetical protein
MARKEDIRGDQDVIVMPPHYQMAWNFGGLGTVATILGIGAAGARVLEMTKESAQGPTSFQAFQGEVSSTALMCEGLLVTAIVSWLVAAMYTHRNMNSRP